MRDDFLPVQYLQHTLPKATHGVHYAMLLACLKGPSPKDWYSQAHYTEGTYLLRPVPTVPTILETMCKAN